MKILMGLAALLLALSWQPAQLAAQDAPAADAPAKEDAPADTGEAPKADEAAKDDDAKAADTKAEPADDDQQAGKTPEPAPIVCTVKDVSRTVEWRPSKDADWQPLTDGDKLPLGADLCTGFRAKCTLVFVDESSVVEVLPLTTLRIGEFERQGEKVRTRLYLMQGGTDSVVEKSRFKSDFAIVTPEITMAVRGTNNIGLRQYWDRGPLVTLSIRGLIVVFDNRNGRVQYVMPRNVVTRGLNTPIQNLKFNSVVPVFDVHGGVTVAELMSLLNGPRGIVGPGSGNAPGGSNLPGGGNPRRAQLIKYINTHTNTGTECEVIVHEWEVE